MESHCRERLDAASACGYLDRLENAVHLVGASLKEAQGFRPLNIRRLVDEYFEGRARLVCYLDVVHGGANYGCLATFRDVRAAVDEGIAVGVFPREGDANEPFGRDKKPVLVDVAELIEDPQGLSRTALIGLNIADDRILQELGQKAEATISPHLTGEAISVVGEWEPGVFALASDGIDERPNDVVEGGAQISNRVADDRLSIATEVMKRLKVVAQTVPLIRFHGQSVVVCIEPAVDPGIKVRNVIACAI